MMNINLVLNNQVATIPDHQNILIDELDNIPISACHSIVVHQVLNYLDAEQIDKLLAKIRHTGVISISSLDIIEATTAFYRNEIELKDFSLLIQNQKLQHSLAEFKEFLERKQFEIESAGLHDIYFQIRAKRP